MTKQEAIDEIKREYFSNDYCLSPKLPTALEIAIECIEKQIPRKPSINERGDKWCPYCVNGHTRQMLLNWNYCPNCGQRLE